MNDCKVIGIAQNCEKGFFNLHSDYLIIKVYYSSDKLFKNNSKLEVKGSLSGFGHSIYLQAEKIINIGEEKNERN